MSTKLTGLTSLDIQQNSESINRIGLYLPQCTTTEIANIDTTVLRNGMAVYNSTTNNYQGYRNGVLCNFVTSLATAAGTGLNGTPVILPSGTAVAVEVAGNQIEGFIYLNTTANTIKTYIGAAWVTVTTA